MTGGQLGGSGPPVCDPNGSAKNEHAGAPTGRAGVNRKTAGDHREDFERKVTECKGDSFFESKGSSGLVKIGGNVEFVLGMKQTAVLGWKSTIDVSKSKTSVLGPYVTGMFAAKYEFLASKKEYVGRKKSDDYLGWNKRLLYGKFTNANAKKVQARSNLEKEISTEVDNRFGAEFNRIANDFKSKAEALRQKFGKFDMKVASQLRVKCEKARMRVSELEREVKNIEYQCGKFERQCKAMDETISALLEIKASKSACKANAVQMKAGVLKFSGSMVKLGE